MGKTHWIWVEECGEFKARGVEYRWEVSVVSHYAAPHHANSRHMGCSLLVKPTESGRTQRILRMVAEFLAFYAAFAGSKQSESRTGKKRWPTPRRW